MKKLVNKLKGNRKPQILPPKPGPDPIRFPDNGGDAKYLVDGSHHHPPPPGPYDHHSTPKEADPQDGIGTFGGFHSWMISFEPNPHGRGLIEMPAPEPQYANQGPHPSEVLSMDDEYPPQHRLSLILQHVKRRSHSATFVVEIIGPWYMTIDLVNDLLVRHGYERIEIARNSSIRMEDWSEHLCSPPGFEIPIVDGPSCYNAAAPYGLLISLTETPDSFIQSLRQLHVRCRDGKVAVQSFPAELEVAFNRTLRLPESGGVHNQPARLGTIPATNISGIRRKLETSGNKSLMEMARKGGVFFPLYQREAMFLSFKAINDCFAVRVSVGGVNGLSGLPWNADPRQRVAIQDYLAIPPQQFLDGVSVGKDVVKQFIVMPMGSGYSVEKQVTGKETIGGMQLEIVPGNSWRLEIPGKTYIPPYYSVRELQSLTPDFAILRNTPEMGGETSINMDEWNQRDKPVYIAHLYWSQHVNALRASAFTPVRKMGRILMTAMYKIRVTLSSAHPSTPRKESKTFEWAPWWPLTKCFEEADRALYEVSGLPLAKLQLFSKGRRLQPEWKTLHELGLLDHAIIDVFEQPLQPTQGYPPLYGAQDSSTYPYNAGYNAGPPQQSPVQAIHDGHPDWDAPYRADDDLSAANNQESSRPGLFSRYGWKRKSSSNAPAPMAHGAPSMAPGVAPRPYGRTAVDSSFPQQLQSHQSSPSASPMLGSMQPQYDMPQMTANRPLGAAPQAPSAQRPPVAMAPQAAYSPVAASPAASPQPYYSQQGMPPQSPSPMPSFASNTAQSPSSPSALVVSSPVSSWDNDRPPVSPVTTTQSPGPGYWPVAHTSPPQGVDHGGYRTPSPYIVSPGSSYSTPSQQPEQMQVQAYSSSPGLAPVSRPTLDQTGWAMGIAAGSRIRQPILKDHFKPEAWARHRATLLSVQILNSVAFEALTGMLAPPSPITPETYAQHGLKFFASYADGVDTDGAKNLAGLKSVGEIDAMGGFCLGVSVASARNVGCTVCRQMLCDAILRPCNHAFCSQCIAKFMTYGAVVSCRVCSTRVTKLVGFSAPMALPGEDRVDLRDVEIVTLAPLKDTAAFKSIYEMSAEPTVMYQSDGSNMPMELP